MKQLKMLCSTLLAVLYFSVPLVAQTPVELYLDRNNSQEVGNSVLELNNGNILVMGITENALSVLPPSQDDIFVTCYSQTTNALLWQRAYGGDFDDSPLRGSLQTQDNSSVVLVGKAGDSNNSSEMLFLRLDPGNGNVLASSRFHSSSLSVLTAVVESQVADDLGNPTSFLVAGLTNTHGEGYLARLNWDGTVIWESTFNATNNNEWVYGLTEDPNTHDVYICGATLIGSYHEPWIIRTDQDGTMTGSWIHDLGADAFYDYVRFNPVTGHLQFAGRRGNQAVFSSIDPQTLPASSMALGVLPVNYTHYLSSYVSRMSQFDYAGFDEILAPITQGQAGVDRARVYYMDFEGRLRHSIEFEQDAIIKRIFPLQNGGFAAIGEQTTGNQPAFMSITDAQFRTACNDSASVITDTTNNRFVTWEATTASWTDAVSVNTGFQVGPVTLATSSNCCDSLQVNVTGPTGICDGTNATLVAAATGNVGAIDYTWNTGETTASIQATPNSTTSYSVTITDQLTGCTHDTSFTLTVFPNPVLSFDVNGPQPACVNTTVDITVNSTTGIHDVVWNSGETSPTITANTQLAGNTFYAATVTDANSCQATDSVSLEVINCCPGYADNMNYLQITPQANDPRLADYGITVNGNIARLTVGEITVLPNKVYLDRNMTLEIRGAGTLADFTNTDMVFGDCAGIALVNQAELIANNAIFRPCDDQSSWAGILLSELNGHNTQASFNECTFVNAQEALKDLYDKKGYIGPLSLEVTNNLFVNCGVGIRISSQEWEGNITGNTFKVNDGTTQIAYCEPVITHMGLVHTTLSTTDVNTWIHVSARSSISQNHFLNATTNDSQIQFEGINFSRLRLSTISSNEFINNDRAIVLINADEVSIENNYFEVTRRKQLGNYQLTLESNDSRGATQSKDYYVSGNVFVNTTNPLELRQDTNQNGNFIGTGAIYSIGCISRVEIVENTIEGFEIGIFTDFSDIDRTPKTRIVNNKISTHWFGIFARGLYAVSAAPDSIKQVYIGCNEIDMLIDPKDTTETVGIFIDPVRRIQDSRYKTHIQMRMLLEGNCVKNTSTAVRLSHSNPCDPATTHTAAYPELPKFRHNYLYNYQDVGLDVINMSDSTGGNNTFISNNDAWDIQHALPFVLPVPTGSLNRTLHSQNDHFGVDGLAQRNPTNIDIIDDLPAHSASSCGNQDLGTVAADQDLACSDETIVGTITFPQMLVQQGSDLLLATAYEQDLRAAFNESPQGALATLQDALALLSNEQDVHTLYQSASQLSWAANEQAWLTHSYALRLQDLPAAAAALQQIQPASQLETDARTFAQLELDRIQNNNLELDSTKISKLLAIAEHHNRYSERARHWVHLQEGGHPYQYKAIKVGKRKPKAVANNDLFANDAGFTLYPNPASTQVQIHILNTDKQWDNLKLWDVQGRLLEQMPIRAYQTQLSVESLAPGVYYVQLTNEQGELSTQKFIKK